MKHKEIFDKAYRRLKELFGDAPDIKILSRFYSEKMVLQKDDYIRYLEILGRVCERATALGEHIRVSGTAGSSFTAFLLGATDINPVPFYEYCPRCKRVEYTDKRMPFDGHLPKCECGYDMICDGYNLPFEMNIGSVLSERIQLGVSRLFFNEAKEMICEYMSDKSIVKLKGSEDISTTWLCFLDKDEDMGGEYSLCDNAPVFENTPHITLLPMPILDKYRELEAATGVRMKDIPHDIIVFFRFIEGDIDGLPYIGSDFMKELIIKTRPEKFEEYDYILKLIGLAHGTNVWKGNAENLYENHIWSLRDIPAFGDDIYEMIYKKLCERGIYETGFAYEVALKARKGYYALNGLDSAVESKLLNLGFDIVFCDFISRINYMFPKAHAVSYLKDAVSVMQYKIHYPEEYRSIFMNRSD